MLGRTGVAHYGRRCSWAHSEGHIGVAHYGILVGGPLQLRWQPIGRRCLWAHLGEVPTQAVSAVEFCVIQKGKQMLKEVALASIAKSTGVKQIPYKIISLIDVFVIRLITKS